MAAESAPFATSAPLERSVLPSDAFGTAMPGVMRDTEMLNSCKAIVLALAALSMGLQPRELPQPMVSEARLPHAREVLKRWLDETGLSGQLELVKLRTALHPFAHPDKRGYRLELRFVPEEKATTPRAAFRTFLEQQRATRGESFPDTCFYRVVHLLDTGRDLVSVHFFVADTEDIVFFDPDSRRVVINENPTRAVRRTVSIPVPQTETARSTTVPRTSTNEIAQGLRRFIEGYFAGSTSAASSPSPQFAWRTFEPDFVSVSVSGLRGRIITDHGYWEKLQISFEIRSEAAAWVLVSYVDGEFASGLGGRQPAIDSYYLIESKFRPQLEAYADRLLTDLHRTLSGSR
jgi:hypothetical protein